MERKVEEIDHPGETHRLSKYIYSRDKNSPVTQAYQRVE